jgi:hypothetical protein
LEFHKEVAVAIPVSQLQGDLSLLKLPDWCSSIAKVIAKEGNRAVVHSDWGPLHVHRELIRTGVRFSVTDDPLALQWTVTSNGEVVTIHITVNALRCSHEMYLRLQAFLSCWESGVTEWRQRKAGEENRSCGRCGDSFGGFG